MAHPGKKAIRTFLLFSTACALTACEPKADSREESAGQKAKPVVYVVNYPLKYFTERIAGDQVQVGFPAPADEDPAYWKPAARTVLAYQEADLILLNGAKYARWIEQVSLPDAKKVDTSREGQGSLIPLDETVTHSHGPEGAHEHTGTAFTTWLDLKLAAKQAGAVQAALSGLRPDLRQAFEEGFQALEADLLDLDRKLEELTSGKEKPLVGSHPVYQYLARRYGLKIQSVHWEPDEMPTEEKWKELEDLLAGHPAKCMIWEGPPLEDVVRKLKELGMESVVYAPCGNAPEEGDFLSVMKQNLENLRSVLAE